MLVGGTPQPFPRPTGPHDRPRMQQANRVRPPRHSLTRKMAAASRARAAARPLALPPSPLPPSLPEPTKASPRPPFQASVPPHPGFRVPTSPHTRAPLSPGESRDPAHNGYWNGARERERRANRPCQLLIARAWTGDARSCAIAADRQPPMRAAAPMCARRGAAHPIRPPPHPAASSSPPAPLPSLRNELGRQVHAAMSFDPCKRWRAWSARGLDKIDGEGVSSLSYGFDFAI
jgi:hypothetical protein